MRQYLSFITGEFKVPFVVFLGILVYLVLHFSHIELSANLIALVVITLGSFGLLKETIESLRKKRFALDYIAILAIFVGVITQEYLVSAILALMISGGSALEAYGVKQAKKSLTLLIDRIPNTVIIWKDNKESETKSIHTVRIGETILVRKGEVIPLDGELLSDVAETDESTLTGEPYFITKSSGDLLRSGTVNIGNPLFLRVIKEEKDSTYRKIIEMVQRAEQEKSPMIRMADRYSVFFTLVTFAIAAIAFIVSDFQLMRVLAVLAVATPCPLIIATPIALLGGMNASAKKKIIIKKIAALETLSRIKTIVFDKTGTITLGRPNITTIEIQNKTMTKDRILAIALAIERNSLHPLAKAIVEHARQNHVPMLHATHIREVVGTGIFGTIEGQEYLLSKQAKGEGMRIILSYNSHPQAVFVFDEEIKTDSKVTIKKLQSLGLTLHIYTGDKKETTERIVRQLGENIFIHAEMSPQDKQNGIKELRMKNVTAMVGDGINDAPALALADVGIAFSNEEQTAASEAADIVLLGGDFAMVMQAFVIARKTIHIATQSIITGIGLSIIAMIFATVGILHPLEGAGIQEAIDIAVILNALRASR